MVAVPFLSFALAPQALAADMSDESVEACETLLACTQMFPVGSLCPALHPHGLPEHVVSTTAAFRDQLMTAVHSLLTHHFRDSPHEHQPPHNVSRLLESAFNSLVSLVLAEGDGDGIRDLFTLLWKLQSLVSRGHQALAQLRLSRQPFIEFLDWSLTHLAIAEQHSPLPSLCVARNLRYSGAMRTRKLPGSDAKETTMDGQSGTRGAMLLRPNVAHMASMADGRGLSSRPLLEYSKAFNSLQQSKFSLYVAGQNRFGELGSAASTKDVLSLTQAHLAHPVSYQQQQQRPPYIQQVAFGNETSAVLWSNGEVYICGYNSRGQCALGSTERSIGSFTLVESLLPGKLLQQDERVVQLGSFNGTETFAAVTNQGRLFTAGNNEFGQAGVEAPAALPSPTLVSALKPFRVSKVATSYLHSAVLCGKYFMQ